MGLKRKRKSAGGSGETQPLKRTEPKSHGSRDNVEQAGKRGGIVAVRTCPPVCCTWPCRFSKTRKTPIGAARPHSLCFSWAGKGVVTCGSITSAN